MKRVALLLFFSFLLGCKKPSPPVVVIDASVPVPAPTASTCGAPETRTADITFVKADTKKALCHGSCDGAPPWVVKPTPDQELEATDIVTTMSGERLAVIRAGSTGSERCSGRPKPFRRAVRTHLWKDEVVVYDDEITMLRDTDGRCEPSGPPTRRRHAVDTRTKKEWVFEGTPDVEVTATEIVAAKAGCTESRHRRTAADVTCEPPETNTADLFIVKGWKAAYAKANGFDEYTPVGDDDAKSTLCRMEACAGAPPWVVKPRVTPHPDPTNLIAPLSGGRLAVLRVGALGAQLCEGRSDAVHNLVDERSITDEVIVWDEEVTPLRHAEDGCEQAGPPRHRWHVVDTRTKKEWVFEGDVTVTVSPKEIVAKKAGCSEIRYSRA